MECKKTRMPKGTKYYKMGGGNQTIRCPCGYTAVGRTEAKSLITIRLHRKYCNALELSDGFVETNDYNCNRLTIGRNTIRSNSKVISRVDIEPPKIEPKKIEPKKIEPKKIEPYTEYVEETGETFYGIYASKK